MKQNIRIVHLNTTISESSAPYRLHMALKKIGIESQILTKISRIKEDGIQEIEENIFYRFLRKIDYIVCQIENKIFYRIEEGMPFSFYRVGLDVWNHKIIKNADIIMIHWIGGNFVSPRGIQKLIKLGKIIIIVCHDNWHFTGGCHVRLGCEKFKSTCGNCPQLNSKAKKDWSYRLLKMKKKMIGSDNIFIVSPSYWMDNNVKESFLFKNVSRCIIPNVLNTDIFRKLDKKLLRQEFGIDEHSTVLVYGAVNAISTPYKGYDQLVQALNIFRENQKELDIVILVFGSSDEIKRCDNSLQIKYMGYLEQNRMVEIYNCADIYIVPSLEDSFNYTVAESLACETPVVAFSTGGIVDIIDHMKCGYLAEYNNPRSLAEGIIWVLENNENNVLGRAGRKKVQEKYSEEVIGKQFKELYQNLMEKKDGSKFI